MTLRMDPHVLAQLLQHKPNGLVQQGIVVDPADTVDVHYFIVRTKPNIYPPERDNRHTIRETARFDPNTIDLLGQQVINIIESSRTDDWLRTAVCAGCGAPPPDPKHVCFAVHKSIGYSTDECDVYIVILPICTGHCEKLVHSLAAGILAGKGCTGKPGPWFDMLPATMEVGWCEWCGSKENVALCGGCKRAVYCVDKDCQELDWYEGGHAEKKSCRIRKEPSVILDLTPTHQVPRVARDETTTPSRRNSESQAIDLTPTHDFPDGEEPASPVIKKEDPDF